MAAAALAIGCGSTPASQAPAKAAPQAPAASTAKVAPSPEQGSRPEEPAADVIVTEDRLVRVTRPSGAGWECDAEQVERIGVQASYVQCRRRTERGTISLMAKDYRVPRALVMSAEELSTVEYPKHYKKRWDSVKYTRSGPVDHLGYPAYEVEIELSNPGGARAHLVERVVVIDTHTINLSADAPPELFVAFESTVKRWFDEADFAALRVDPRKFAVFSPLDPPGAAPAAQREVARLSAR